MRPFSNSIHLCIMFSFENFKALWRASFPCFMRRAASFII